MSNLYHRIIEQIQEDLFEEAEGSATTMDAVSYLPAQVGVVKTAMKKLRKTKSKWGIEVLESTDGYTLNFEDQLTISVLFEDWDEFQETFGTQIDEEIYEIQLEQDVEMSAEDLIESRKDELLSKVKEITECQEVKTAEKIVYKFLKSFNCLENITHTIDPMISLFNLDNYAQQCVNSLTEDYEEDLGHLEMLIENFNLSEGSCLAGARFSATYDGIKLTFEAKVSHEKDCSFSMLVNDTDIADQLEENCIGLSRIGNVFYPAVGQVLSENGILESLKEIIDDSEGEDNEE